MAIYDQHGIRFSYPDSWEFDSVRDGEQLTLSVNSPSTSFWSITLFFEQPDNARVLQQVLEALRDEYGDIECETEESSDGLYPTSVCEIDFVCLELINSAQLRSIETPDFTALVYYQGTDHELVHTREHLEEITDSLIIDPAATCDPLGQFGL